MFNWLEVTANVLITKTSPMILPKSSVPMPTGIMTRMDLGRQEAKGKAENTIMVTGCYWQPKI